MEEKIFSAKIEEMNTLGNGIVKIDGCVVFVLGAVEGDVVTARITEEKKNYKIAEIVTIDEPSPYRCDASCSVYGRCGGCKLSHISYEHEAEIKKLSVAAALRRGGLGDVAVERIITGEPERYRNKAVFRIFDGEFGFSEEKGDGFVPCRDCLICPVIFSEIAGFTAKDKDSDKISYLYLRRSSLGEISCVIGRRGGTAESLSPLAERISEEFSDVVCVMTKAGEHPEDGKSAESLIGDGYINESFLGLDLQVSPDSFFQVNHSAAEEMFRAVSEMSVANEGAFGIDLYCGTGVVAMANAVLHPDAFITGVEINPAAVEDAKENAEANGLSNLGFFCGDSADFAKSIYGSIDFATIDPPRAGCSEAMIKQLLRLHPERLVYISCDPSSLARDLKKLTEKKYKIEKVIAADLFPRTKHVESVVLLTKVHK